MTQVDLVPSNEQSSVTEDHSTMQGSAVHHEHKSVSRMKYIVMNFINAGQLLVDPFSVMFTTSQACMNILKRFRNFSTSLETTVIQCTSKLQFCG